jgi:uncharacterized protein
MKRERPDAIEKIPTAKTMGGGSIEGAGKMFPPSLQMAKDAIEWCIKEETHLTMEQFRRIVDRARISVGANNPLFENWRYGLI